MQGRLNTLVAPNPVLFFPANTHLFGFASTPDMAGFGWRCWSVFALENFPCYDYGQTMQYSYTLGGRTQDAVAVASAVSPGSFTRMAVLAPLATATAPAFTPLMRIERQRMAGGPYAGETVQILGQRHGTDRVKWPDAMRGVNSWHSDGYVWALPWGITGPEPGLAVSDRYCFVSPPSAVQSTHPISLFAGRTVADGGDTVALGVTGTVSFQSTRVPAAYAPFTFPTSDCAFFAGATPFLYSAIATTGNAKILQGGVGLRDDLSSAYSPWDVYIGTSDFSNEEFAVRDAATGNAVVASKYAKVPTLNTHGISGAMVANQAPTPLVIAAKYR